MYFSVNGWLIDDDEIYPKKPNHKAPKFIRGDYDLSIHSNKIVLVDNVDGTTVEAKCHPDDDFDIGVGIKEAFRKMNNKRVEIGKAKESDLNCYDGIYLIKAYGLRKVAKPYV